MLVVLYLPGRPKHRADKTTHTTATTNPIIQPCVLLDVRIAPSVDSDSDYAQRRDEANEGSLNRISAPCPTGEHVGGRLSSLRAADALGRLRGAIDRTRFEPLLDRRSLVRGIE